MYLLLFQSNPIYSCTQGHVVDLSISHQQLNLRLKLFRTVKTRYVQRLKWLTKEGTSTLYNVYIYACIDSSRAIFGCITGKKVSTIYGIICYYKFKGCFTG